MWSASSLATSTAPDPAKPDVHFYISVTGTPAAGTNNLLHKRQVQQPLCYLGTHIHMSDVYECACVHVLNTHVWFDDLGVHTYEVYTNHSLPLGFIHYPSIVD